MKKEYSWLEKFDLKIKAHNGILGKAIGISPNSSMYSLMLRRLEITYLVEYLYCQLFNF